MKSAERQAALVDNKTREFLVRQQTRTVNAIRAHLAEFGPRGPWLGRNPPLEGFVRASPHPSPSVVPKGIQNVGRLLTAAGEVPEAARPALDLLAAQLRDIRTRIAEVTKRIEGSRAEDALARRLATIPGIGALTASALAATTPEVDAFRSAGDYAAWLGLTPKPHSTGGKERLGRISKAGNRYLRRLLFLGASCRRHAFGVTAEISARRGRKPGEDWLSRMLQRKRVKVGAIALANRMARLVWALIRSGEIYRANPA